MKFPNFNMNKSFTARALVLLAGLFLMAASISAQKIDAPLANNAAGNLDQCRNGDGTAPCDATTSNQTGWFNGNVGKSNSSYSEDQYLPYRMTFTGLTVGTNYTVVLGYDATHSGKHAIDYLGSFDTLTIANRTTNTAAVRAGVDPCSGVAGCVLASPTSTAPITADDVAVTNETNPFTNSPIYQPSNQQFTMWGGTGLTFAYESIDGNVLVDAQVERRVRLTFTASVSNPVLAWSGHVAYGGDWGAGNSAGGISGSPYHMRLIGLCVTTDPAAPVGGCTTGGNQDRSLSADAVIITGIVNITKVANDFPAGGTTTGTANVAFPFSATGPFGQSSFTIVDNNPGPGGVTVQSASISLFGAANNITVTEGTTFGWQLTDLSCTNNVASSFTANGTTGQVVITTNAGGVTSCTFTNGQLGITAAPATIGGRVTTAYGNGISGVSVGLTDLSTGKTRYALTNSFGYYTFTNCMTEDFYFVGIESKRYRFATNQKSFTLLDNLLDVNFVANP